MRQVVARIVQFKPKLDNVDIVDGIGLPSASYRIPTQRRGMTFGFSFGVAHQNNISKITVSPWWNQWRPTSYLSVRVSCSIHHQVLRAGHSSIGEFVDFAGRGIRAE